MATIINTKIGENRGRARIWLEGFKLQREGFEPGMRYDLELQDSKVVLRARDQGHFTISRRERNGRVTPIIDICSNELRRLFAGVQLLRVAIREGLIVIVAHHSQKQAQERVQRLATKLREGKPLDVCSLFHGGGILDKALHAGLQAAGVQSRVLLAVEMEQSYLDASLANNPELWSASSVVCDSPIQAVDPRREGVSSVDVLVGGIPCTGASRPGKAKNKNEFTESHEDAGAMFFYFLQFVRDLNPAVVLIENVTEYANSASMAVIRSVLGSLGYRVQERVMGGPEFGALEWRRRLCVVATSEGLEDAFDLQSVQGVPNPSQRVRDVLEDIALDSDRWKPFDYLAEKEQRDRASGNNFARKLLSGDETFCGTIGRGYSKCRSTEPFLVHPQRPELLRIFTPREHARVKGVPEEVVDGLPESIAHQVLGQSVIFPVFKAVGLALGQSLTRWVKALHKQLSACRVFEYEEPQLALL